MTSSQIQLLNYVRKRPRTTYEVSEWLAVSLSTARNRLNLLVDRGALRVSAQGHGYTYEVAK